MIKVSILCTAYNHEKYIAQALDSFLAQKTDFAFEIIVTDDASTDNTPGILSEYASSYPDKVRYFHQDTNLFSKGIDTIYETIMYPNARGSYIAFCEGDDYWCDPDKLQMQVDFLDSHPDYSACVHNSYYHYCEDDRQDELVIPQSEDHDVPFSKIITGMNNCFHTSSIVARKEYIVDPPDYEMVAADYGFLDYPWAICLSLNGKIRYIDRAMSVYRINSIDESWRSGYDKDYSKKIRFVEGEVAMIGALLSHLSGDNLAVAEEELLKRKYEYLYLTGDVKKLVRPPYRSIYKKEPFVFKLKTALKLIFPTLHNKYRARQGYSK